VLIVTVRTYLDLTVERRKAAAQSLRDRQMSILADPFSTPEHKALAQAKLQKIRGWENGTVSVSKGESHVKGVE
jgi:hypothetical protein